MSQQADDFELVASAQEVLPQTFLLRSTALLRG